MFLKSLKFRNDANIMFSNVHVVHSMNFFSSSIISLAYNASVYINTYNSSLNKKTKTCYWTLLFLWYSFREAAIHFNNKLPYLENSHSTVQYQRKKLNTRYSVDNQNSINSSHGRSHSGERSSRTPENIINVAREIIGTGKSIRKVVEDLQRSYHCVQNIECFDLLLKT